MHPPIPRAALFIEMLAGAFGGVLIAVPATYVLAPLLGLDLFSGTLLAALAYPIGAALGVWLAARRLIGRGRLWYALVGAFLPLLLIAMIFSLNSFLTLVLSQIAFAVLPPITAALALHRFSRRTDPINPYEDDDVDLRAYQEEGWEDD